MLCVLVIVCVSLCCVCPCVSVCGFYVCGVYVFECGVCMPLRTSSRALNTVFVFTGT